MPDQLLNASWWPTPDVWNSSGFGVGYWTQTHENWFQSRRDAILKKDAQLNKKVVWRNVLKQERIMTGELRSKNAEFSAALLERSAVRSTSLTTDWAVE